MCHPHRGGQYTQASPDTALTSSITFALPANVYMQFGKLMLTVFSIAL